MLGIYATLHTHTHLGGGALIRCTRKARPKADRVEKRIMGEYGTQVRYAVNAEVGGTNNKKAAKKK